MKAGTGAGADGRAGRMRALRAGLAMLLAAAWLAGPAARDAAAQHQDFMDRARWSVVGEHGAYNIAWINLTDMLLLAKPRYELMITYHPAGRGPGAVKARHWEEMVSIAREEIARRCPPPGRWEIVSSRRDYDPSERRLGAELRVTYTCE